MTSARLVAVAAVAANGVIGRDGAMPWRLRTDLARFRRLTLGKPLILGRRTLESIGRALDGRDTIVLTRTGTSPVPGVHAVASPEAAVALARALAEERGADEIVVAGGAEVYRLFLPTLARLYLTHVEAEPAGDAVFPPLDPAEWRLRSEEAVPAGANDDAATRFAIYDRQPVA